MKRIFLLIVAIALFAATTVTVQANPAPAEQANPHTVNSDSPVLKAIFGVRHEFPGRFTADLAPGQIGLLKAFGVETEPVNLYHILPPNKCGDGTCQGFESPETCPEDCGGSGECYPDNQYPWGVVKVNGGSGGSGVRVAVLDTGIDQDHPDLVNNIVACSGFGYTTCEDDDGHGTHVSGTVLASGKIVGVAPSTNLMMGKVCGPQGCYTDDIAAGIIWAADTGADVISMSLGGDSPDSLIKDAVDYAVSKGVLVIAAAGNDGPDDGSIDYPGAYAEVVAVGAIDSGENVADWSSRGISDGNDSVISEGEVEFGAPGVNVESAYNDGCYAYMSGTSMATPHVSGLASKVWQGTAWDTRAYLRTIAKDIYTSGYDTATGYGLPIAPACSSDGDCGIGQICCSGQCISPACSSDTDCDDNNACTTDTCNYPGTCEASCSHAEITECIGGDGCCPSGCDSTTDSDCSEDSCDNCFKGVCDGNCHPVKEDSTCPDCL